MKNFLKIDVDIDEKSVQQKVDNLIDDFVMIQIHMAFARLINPYVPMDTGRLSQNIETTKDYVRYKQVYAHYMYMGIKYGPNIPQFDEFGNISGFVSPKGKKKHSTGEPLTIYKEEHPLATAQWDKVAMQTQLAAFEQTVKNILVRRARELYG